MREKTNKKDFKKKIVYHEKEYIKRIDKSSHFPFNYLVIFYDKSGSIKRAVVNARDEFGALYKAIRQAKRAGVAGSCSRVCVSYKIENKKRSVSCGVLPCK